LPKTIRRAERHDPARVVEVLERFTLERRRDRLHDVIARRLASVTVCFDAPHDPHNGAAVIRSCEAFGVQALHVIERRESFLAAASVTRGAERWVDVHAHPGTASATRALVEGGFEIVAAVADGDLSPEDLARIPRVALVLGNEHDGIDDELRAACTRTVRVPMRGFTESLNVSVTCAILLQHATAGRAGDLPEADRLRLYARGLYFTVEHAEELLGGPA
jgi:tRNA (guanosine-2'-O-)-methyltransferase